MTDNSVSLQGYGYPIHKRDGFRCRYCGVDGADSFDAWLTFTVDHLLPKGHPDRDNPDYIVTACQFCNVADNHYFEKADQLGLRFDGLTPDELVAQRLPFVQERRKAFQKFWQKNVKPLQE